MSSVSINTKLYGALRKLSPVLQELLASNPVQRLKYISQSGQPEELETRTMGTRFDHCVGVMLLLQKLGATEEEQIAGLLHDVSHTAFSHTIDHLTGGGIAEDFQDKSHKTYILTSIIPSILQKYNYKVERIYEYHHFTLLEKDIPDLCADRVDYSLREFRFPVAKRCLNNLTVYDSMIVFTDVAVAKEFALGFLEAQERNWGYEENVIREYLFSRFLQKALDKNIIQFEDFWKDDIFVMQKIHDAKDEELETFLRFIKQPLLRNLPKSDTIIHKKFRHVNPHIVINDKLFRLTELDEEFRNELEEARKRNQQGIHLPNIPNFL